MVGYVCDFCSGEFDGVANKCLFCEGEFCRKHVPADAHDCPGKKAGGEAWEKLKPAAPTGQMLLLPLIVAILLMGLVLSTAFEAAPTERSNVKAEKGEECLVPRPLYIPYSIVMGRECGDTRR